MAKFIVTAYFPHHTVTFDLDAESPAEARRRVLDSLSYRDRHYIQHLTVRQPRRWLQVLFGSQL